MTTNSLPSSPYYTNKHQSADVAAGTVSSYEHPLAKLRVLVVDDEQFICEMLERLLIRRGYEVMTFHEGSSALEALRKEPFDAILLDIRMPEPDGISICRELRTFSDTVVIMLTALNRPDDVIQGFMAGADDYIIKPFRLPELDARIRANVRRAALVNQRPQLSNTHADVLYLNCETREVLLADTVRQLAAKEFALLKYLVDRANQPVDKSELLWQIWGFKDMKRANLVETAVRRVRVKVEEDPARPVRLVTCRPAGYMYVTADVPITYGSEQHPG